MAKPDCDDGWIKKSVEVEAALSLADFIKPTQVVLRYMFAQIFGRGPRPAHAIISCSEIAERIGRSRQYVSRGLHVGIASKAVVKVDGIKNAYAFNKDYEQWRVSRRDESGTYQTGDEPLLTPAEIADCKASPSYAYSFIQGYKKRPAVIQTVDKTSTECRTEAPESVIHLVDKPVEPVIHLVDARHPFGRQDVIQTVDKTVPPHTPLLGTELQSIREFSLSSDEDKAATPRKKSRKKSEPKSRPLPTRPAPVPGDDAAMKWVRDMVLNGTRDEKHPTGDHERAAQAIQAMLDWRAANYADADIKHGFLKAVQGRLVRKPGFFEYAKSVMVGQVERRATVPTAPKPAPSAPIIYHRADPTRPDPSRPDPNRPKL